MYKRNLCAVCDKYKVIVNKKFKLCNYHNSIRLNAKKSKPIYSLRKKTDKQKLIKEKDIIFYQQCFYYSNMTCEECNISLGNEWKPEFCAHIISKGVNTAMRYDPTNHVMLCFDCHDKLDKTKMKIYKMIEKTRQDLHLEYSMKNKMYEDKNT